MPPRMGTAVARLLAKGLVQIIPSNICDERIVCCVLLIVVVAAAAESIKEKCIRHMVVVVVAESKTHFSACWGISLMLLRAAEETKFNSRQRASFSSSAANTSEFLIASDAREWHAHHSTDCSNLIPVNASFEVLSAIMSIAWLHLRVVAAYLIERHANNVDVYFICLSKPIIPRSIVIL
jgi:hypothetical protein